MDDTIPSHLLLTLLLLVVSVLLIFYFPRGVGKLLSVIITAYTWSKYRIELKAESLSLSIVGGYVLFKKFSCVSENFTIRAVHGKISLRYWIRDILSKTKEQQVYKLAIELDGVEIYCYNYTQTYDWIQKIFYSAQDSHQSHEKGNSIDDDTMSVKALKIIQETSIPYLNKLLPIEIRITSQGAIFMGHPKAPTFLLTTFSECKGDYHTTTCKNPLDSYKNILNFTFHSIQSRLFDNPFLKKQFSSLYYSKDTDATRSENISRSDDLRKHRGIKRFTQGLKKAWNMFVYWAKLSGSSEKNPLSKLWMQYQHPFQDKNIEFRADDMKHMITMIKERYPMLGISEDMYHDSKDFWTGLGRYQDGHGLLKEMIECEEYARVDQILSTDEMQIIYQYDVPGPVFDIENDQPPDYHCSIIFKSQTKLSYGPYIQKSLTPLINFYFPFVYLDLVQQSERKRTWEFIVFQIEFEKGFLFDITHREPSKNSILVSKMMSDTSLSNITVDQVLRSIIYSMDTSKKDQHSTLPEYMIRQPVQWALSTNHPANISIKIPQQSHPKHGYQADIHCSITGESTFSLTRHSCPVLVPSEVVHNVSPIQIDLNMITPVIWSHPRVWNWGIQLGHHLDIYLLSQHVDIWVDLLADWDNCSRQAIEQWYHILYDERIYRDNDSKTVTIDTESDISSISDKIEEKSLIRTFQEYERHFFIPYDIKYHVNMKSGVIYLHVNEFNVMNQFKDKEHSSFLELSFQDADISWSSLSDFPFPLHLYTSFNICFSKGIEISLDLQDCDTNHIMNSSDESKKSISLLKTDTEFALNGTLDSMSKQDPDTCTDSLHLHIYSRDIQILLLGITIKYWDIFLENYFGLDCNVLPFGEYKERILQKNHLDDSNLDPKEMILSFFGQHFTSRMASGKNPLYLHIQLISNSLSISCSPCLYHTSNIDLVHMNTGPSRLDFINSFRYSRLVLDIPNIRILPENNTYYEHIYVDSLKISLIRNYNETDGIMISDCLNIWIDNQIESVLEISSLIKLYACLESIVFGYKDLDNSLIPPRPTIEDYRNASNVRTRLQCYINAPIHVLLIQLPVSLFSISIDKNVYFDSSRFHISKISCHSYHISDKELYLIFNLNIDQISYGTIKDTIPKHSDFEIHSCPDDYIFEKWINKDDIKYDDQELIRGFLNLFQDVIDYTIHSFGKGEIIISNERSSTYLPGAIRIKHPQQIFLDTKPVSETTELSNNLNIKSILMVLAPSMMSYSWKFIDSIATRMSVENIWSRIYTLDRLNILYRSTLANTNTKTFYLYDYPNLEKKSNLNIGIGQLDIVAKVEHDYAITTIDISMYPINIKLDIYCNSKEESLKEMNSTVSKWIQGITLLDPSWSSKDTSLRTIRYKGVCKINTIEGHINTLEPSASMILEDINIIFNHEHRPNLVDIIKSRPIWIEQLKKDKSKYHLWKWIVYNSYYTMSHQSLLDILIPAHRDSKSLPTITVIPFTSRGDENLIKTLENHLMDVSKKLKEFIKHHFSVNIMEIYKRLLSSLAYVTMESFVQDPVFISRPSDLWRLSRPSMDAGWKLLFRLYTLITRMDQQSVSSSNLLSTILNSPLGTWRSWELGSLDQCRLLKFLYSDDYLPRSYHITNNLFLSSFEADSESDDEEISSVKNVKSHFIHLNCLVNHPIDVSLDHSGSRVTLPMLKYTCTILSYDNISSNHHSLYFDGSPLKVNLDHAFVDFLLHQLLFYNNSIDYSIQSIDDMNIILSKSSFMLILPLFTCIIRIQCPRVFLTLTIGIDGIKLFTCFKNQYQIFQSILYCEKLACNITEEDGSIQTFIGQLDIEAFNAGSFTSQEPHDIHDRRIIRINSVILHLDSQWNELIMKDYVSIAVLKMQQIMDDNSTETKMYIDHAQLSMLYPIKSTISMHQRIRMDVLKLSYSKIFSYIHSGHVSLVPETRIDPAGSFLLLLSIPRIIYLISKRRIMFFDLIDAPIQITVPFIQECVLLHRHVIEAYKFISIPLYEKKQESSLLYYSILLYHLDIRLDDKIGLSLTNIQVHMDLIPNESDQIIDPNLLSVKIKKKRNYQDDDWLKRIKNLVFIINHAQCFLPSFHDRDVADQDTEQMILFDMYLKTFTDEKKKLDVSCPRFKAIMVPEIWIEIVHEYIIIWENDITSIIKSKSKRSKFDSLSSPITINIERDTERYLWQRLLIQYPLIEWTLSNFQLVQIFSDGSSKMSKVAFASVNYMSGTAKLIMEENISSDLEPCFLIELESSNHLDILWVQGEDELLRLRIPKFHGILQQKKFISSYVERDSLSNIWQIYCVLDQPPILTLNQSKWHLIQPPKLPSNITNNSSTSMVILSKICIPSGGKCCFNESDQFGHDDHEIHSISFDIPAMTLIVDRMNHITDINCYIGISSDTLQYDAGTLPVTLTFTPKILELFNSYVTEMSIQNVQNSFNVDISLSVHMPSVPLRICMACDTESETTALKVLGYIECSGKCGFHMLTIMNTRKIFVWIDKFSLSIRHIYAPEDCFSASFQGIRYISDTLLYIESISLGLHLRYLQDLFIFSKYWTPHWIDQLKTSKSTDISLYVHLAQVKVDASQAIGNILLVSNELKYLQDISIPLYGIYDVFGCQSVLISSQGKLLASVDCRILDVLINASNRHIIGVSWLDIKFEQPQSQIVTSTNQSTPINTATHISDLLFLAHYVGILVSDQWKNIQDIEWSIDITWESCITILSGRTAPILYGFMHKLESLIEERISLANEALSKRFKITQKSTIPNVKKYSVKKCYIHGNEFSLYLFPTTISNDTNMLTSHAQDIALSFSKTVAITIPHLEQEDIKAITHVLRSINGVDLDKISFEWSDMLLQVGKLEIQKMSLNAPLKRIIAIAIPATINNPVSQVGVMQWIDLLGRDDWIMEKRKILGVDSICSLLMETYDPKSSTFRVPDLIFYKLATEFGGPIDLSLHLGMYKFVKELFVEYRHQMMNISGTLSLDKSSMYGTTSFIALVPVHVEPRLKLMAEATPKLERILEWFNLGHEELEATKIEGEMETTTKVTGTVRSDRKDVMAAMIYRSVLHNIDEVSESLKILYDH